MRERISQRSRSPRDSDVDRVDFRDDVAADYSGAPMVRVRPSSHRHFRFSMLRRQIAD